MGSKKFWQRGSVSKMLEKPGKAFKKTFRVVRGRKDDFEALAKILPDYFAKLDRGAVILDQGFPIREGESRIDYLVCNLAGELTFVWLQRRCNSESLSKLLPDYHWIQKNCSIWTHLFPQALKSQQLQMKVWIFALEIDADLQYLLTYLQGVRIEVFRALSEGESWRFQAWKVGQKLPAAPVLPSSPSLLSLAEAPKPPAPKPAPVVVRPAAPLLTQEEINDLLGGVQAPAEKIWKEDEDTDPHYQL
ncbi:MAG TPA: hypothetical protein VJP40_01215 [bacterium]|nr:hypothetical protein [bacterium]